MLTLKHVLNALSQPLAEAADFPITGGSIDSRLTRKNDLFVALAGENTDGHQFVDQAFQNGACLALVEKTPQSAYPVVDLAQSQVQLPKEPPFSLKVPNTLQALQTIASYWRSQFDIHVVGITGSVGKSSTKELTAAVLSTRFVTLKNPGNMNNEIGLPLTLLSLNESHQAAVLEMGFYVPGEIQFLCRIARPEIGVITNVGTVHAERAGSIDAIARGKAELVEALPPAPQGVAILNQDDPLVRGMAAKTSARIFYYGLTPQADLWADEIESHGLEGVRCRIHYQGESLYLTAPLIGRHSIYTILRSSAVALAFGLSWDEIFEGLNSGNTQIRIVTTRTHSGAILIDDSYNASPDSDMAALNLLDELQGRKIAVLGDMLELGQYEQEGHEKVGLRASEVADELVLIGKRSLIMRAAALSNDFPAERIHWFPTPAEAKPFLKELLKDGDVALVKGSHSMHLEEIISALEELQ